MYFHHRSKLENLRISHIIAAIALMIGIAFLVVTLDPYSYLRAHGYPRQLVSAFQAFLVLCAGVAFLIKIRALSISGFGFMKEKRKNTLLWGCIGGLLLGIVQFPYKIVAGDRSVPMDLYVDSQYHGLFWILLFLLFVTILIPILQELFYRFYLYWGIRNRFGRFWAYSASALLFSLGHEPFNSGRILLFLLSSLILTYLSEKTEYLGSSVIAHMVWNAIWYTAAYLLV